MASVEWQKLCVMAVAMLFSILCGPPATMAKTSSAPTSTAAAVATEVHVSHAHKNTAAYAKRRSYSSDPAAATLNGLAHLQSEQHISGSYGYDDTDASGGGGGGGAAKQQTPIYEEQQENDYDVAAEAGYNGERNQHGGSAAGANALRTAIYNLHAAGTHNGFLPSLGYGKYTSYSSSPSSTPQHHHEPLQTHDKISAGNFLHHYERNYGYDESSAADELQQLHQQQQQQQPEQQHYFSPHIGSTAAGDAGASASPTPYGYAQQQSPSAPGDYDEATNYLPSAHHAPPPDVINYIPYPVVKKYHVPVREPVRIPVSHAVIVPVSKPVPIHIPVTQNIQVPVEKELKIPVERVVPYPVEKHVPVPVEKRVPYPVVKYVPIKVPRPFPVKVPVFKTILHKVKSWW